MPYQTAYCDGMLTMQPLLTASPQAAGYSDPAIRYLADGVTVNPVLVPHCSGSWVVEDYRNIELVFNEYLAPDVEIVSLIIGTSLVFWITGHWLGRVMRVFRKV